jgi:iron complex outermembrane recepter protein
MRIARSLVVLSVVGALSISTRPATAQVLSADTLDIIQLDPVQVNVLRTPFELTAAPFAVAANDEEAVQRARPGLGTKEAFVGIPGVQIDDRYNYALGDRISIRGFGARTQFGVRGITVYVDGIPATLPDGQTNLNHVDLSFLRRVEVIRGPASSMYGNAAGGVIQFETEAPPPVPLSQEVGVVAGSNGLLRLHSTTGGQAAGASYLLNIARLTYDGYRMFQEAENLQVNGSVGFSALRGTLRLIGSYVDYDANNPGSLNIPLLAANRDTAFTGNVNNKTGEEGTQNQFGANWRGSLAGVGMEISGYTISREIDNPIPASVIDIERRASGLSATARSSGDAASTGFHWALGVEGDLQEDKRKNFANVLGERGALTLDQEEEVRGLSVFGQLTAVPMPRLVAVGGLRYDVTEFSAADAFISATNPDDSGERTMDAISPSIGVSFAVADAISLYGNVATSFETPTTTELTNRETGAGGFSTDLEPQKTLSFEAGAKGLLPGRVSYQLSVFRANIEDAVIPFETPDFPGRFFYRNAGSTVHDGVEAGLAVAPLAGLRASVAYTYLDARFDDYTVGINDFSGNRVPGVSPHRVDASLGYTAPFGFHITVDGRYVDRIMVNDANTSFSPAYTVFDFRAGLERVGFGGFALEPFFGVSNFLDEEYNTSVTVNAFGNPGRYFEPGPGRALYGGGQIRFELDD